MTIREKILVIEDEQTISNFISAILTANGYDVLLARNGAVADSMIASHCPDIIILDLGLPDMDGMEILHRVRAWSKVPIVVVSARSHEQDKVAALDAGADDYLTKPFGTEELMARIRRRPPYPHADLKRIRRQHRHFPGGRSHHRLCKAPRLHCRAGCDAHAERV